MKTLKIGKKASKKKSDETEKSSKKTAASKKAKEAPTKEPGSGRYGRFVPEPSASAIKAFDRVKAASDKLESLTAEVQEMLIALPATFGREGAFSFEHPEHGYRTVMSRTSSTGVKWFIRGGIPARKAKKKDAAPKTEKSSKKASKKSKKAAAEELGMVRLVRTPFVKSKYGQEWACGLSKPLRVVTKLGGNHYRYELVSYVVRCNTNTFDPPTASSPGICRRYRVEPSFDRCSACKHRSDIAPARIHKTFIDTTTGKNQHMANIDHATLANILASLILKAIDGASASVDTDEKPDTGKSSGKKGKKEEPEEEEEEEEEEKPSKKGKKEETSSKKSSKKDEEEDDEDEDDEDEDDEDEDEEGLDPADALKRIASLKKKDLLDIAEALNAQAKEQKVSALKVDASLPEEKLRKAVKAGLTTLIEMGAEDEDEDEEEEEEKPKKKGGKKLSSRGAVNLTRHTPLCSSVG